MAFDFLHRKAKPKRKYHRRKKNSIARSQYRGSPQNSHKAEIRPSQGLETNETNQILARLDVMMGYLREHHNVIKNQVEASSSDLKQELLALGAAKKLLKETKLDRIVQEKLSRGETKSQIVRQLIETGACSRATAYRVLERNEVSQMSQISQIVSHEK